jgi:TPR repeat protein
MTPRTHCTAALIALGVLSGGLLSACATLPRSPAASAAKQPEHDPAELAKMDLAQVQLLAKAGDTNAIIDLATRYGNGKDVPKDGKKALSLLNEAVAKGSTQAMFLIGAAYAKGFAGSADQVQARKWYERAAAAGNMNGEYWVGLVIGRGLDGNPANWHEAMPWLERAAAHGHSDAAFMIGWLYETGALGHPQVEEAAKWYRLATSKELNQKAQFNLRSMIDMGLIAWQPGDPGKPEAQDLDRFISRTK